MAIKLVVELVDIEISNITELKQQWQKLESSSKNSIFTSWPWISNWLKFINYDVYLIQVSFNGEVVGLGFLKENSKKKYGIISKQLWLNRTGDDTQDQIWSEYNDVLCVYGMEYSIRAAILEYFENNLSHFDEIIIGASNSNIVQTPHSKKIMQYTSWKTTSYSRTLLPEYSDWRVFLQTLSRNSRSQIKRSATLYGGVENFIVKSAKSVNEALSFFKAAGEFHKLRWKENKSGFNNPLFVSFHESFITQNFDRGYVDIVKVEINGQPICYLYNLIYKNTVYFYLSGIKYSDDNKLKPGLLSHSLAIAHYAKLAYEKYDFMGGEGRYKNSLSDSKGSMIISNFRRRNIPFMLSRSIRKAKAIYSQVTN